MPSFLFLFVLFGQNRLQHIAGLGNVRQIDLGNDGWRRMTRRRRRMRGGLRIRRETRANLLGLVVFQRTGVCFDASDAEFRENLDNRAWLDFQLTR
jgi:hypothetical protein